jgi:hypothetical protein
MQGGYFLNARILFRIAKEAYKRTEDAPSETASGQDDALVAVLFSAASLEVFIMELALHADFGGKVFDRPPYLSTLADILDEVEASRGSVRLKFLLTKAILPGEPYAKGTLPYQDFDRLFSLRNLIVHLKPEKIESTPPSLAEALAQKGLCEHEEPNVKSSWLDRIATRALARWACNVVADMVDSLRKEFPVDGSTHPPTLFHTEIWSSGFERIE